MSKTLSYRIFGLGAVPRELKNQILSEGVVLEDEGLRCYLTFRKYRAPGKYYGFRRTWFSGSVVLTKEHFLAFKYSKPVIGVPWRDSKFKELDVSLENKNTLCIKFDASTFEERSSGNIEVRFSTPPTPEFLQQIEQHAAQG